MRRGIERRATADPSTPVAAATFAQDDRVLVVDRIVVVDRVLVDDKMLVVDVNRSTNKLAARG